jgi:methylated-DNA-[protein]-cysteine S-methyltransferase
MAVGVVRAPFGVLTVGTTELGVARVDFGEHPHPDLSTIDSAMALAHLEQARSELSAYFNGSCRHFTVELDRSARRGFRGAVLAALETVPFGEVVSYGELAQRTRRPGAARAVGTAMATNPIGVIVPCHRVVRANGSMGGFGGGPAAKRWLLEREGWRPAV